ncbi:cysteine-rich motor neuron 1 protein isoform X2 [Macrobrachium rosenbergii]|uniref:cysteine-rich motor neuron 1 protein isoform X2 n=1 Tax=Macrobrachium rosenbergii TaxID=79674 RepID=UPI0034D58854
MGVVSNAGVGGVMLAALLLSLAAVLGGCSSTQPTLEIKTEAPDAPISHKGNGENSGSFGLTGVKKDCPVYVLGELKAIRKHGEKWRNDGSDCEICKCTDGQSRCYYHYCNGLTEGYMTPPSVLGPGDKTAADQPPARPPLDDEDHLEEGSGAQPWPDDSYKIIEESRPHDLDLASSTSRREKTDGEDKNPRDNETHEHLSPPDLCGRPCKKNCPQGYKVDPVTGCRRCKCLNCQSLKQCKLKCPDGFELDKNGCKTCHCRNKNKNTLMTVITTSLDGDDFIVEDGYALSESYNEGEDQVTYNEIGGRGGVYVTSKDEEVYATAGDTSSDTVDPSCNTTRLGGCTDGRRVFTVGSWWERGPCVSCVCIAPGYTECNVTQCAPLPCSPSHQIKLEDSCCPICEETTKSAPINDRGHESRSTSRVPLDRMPPTRPHDLEHEHLLPTEDNSPHHFDSPPREDDGTTKSAVQARGIDSPEFVAIFVIVAVVSVIVLVVIAYIWRRNHRDKYDINAYRPEETEKLRPVKTADDNHQVRHV